MVGGGFIGQAGLAVLGPGVVLVAPGSVLAAGPAGARQEALGPGVPGAGGELLGLPRRGQGRIHGGQLARPIVLADLEVEVAAVLADPARLARGDEGVVVPAVGDV